MDVVPEIIPQPIIINMDVVVEEGLHGNTVGDILNQALAELINGYIHEGGDVDEWTIKSELVDTDSHTGVRLTLDGLHKNKMIPNPIRIFVNEGGN